ncbi:DUF6266 family protein [Pedobacter deserti]|uniref:DUF6266 family protein n=1 Tax=Pedobacter deserti TaxID=2817382 RepID=UPI0021087E73|nr:DUF6266 family protein [Pedobacter sp. SYSU D00382]
MGVIKKNIHGVLSGKVGNLVYYELMGMNVVRMIGENNAPPSRKQLACRQRMRVIMDMLRPAKAFIKRGYMLKARQAGLYPHNLAVASLMEHALTGAYPHTRIDYSKVLVSSGSLPVAKDVKVKVAGAVFEFSWAVPAGLTLREKGHRAMMLAFFPAVGKVVYQLAGAHRGAGTDVLPLPADLPGEEAYCYLSFIDLETDDTSDSSFAGCVIV